MNGTTDGGRGRKAGGGGEGGEEVNGVVFLSSSAPERGERWGAGGQRLGGQCDRRPLCVCVCVNVRLDGRECL